MIRYLNSNPALNSPVFSISSRFALKQQAGGGQHPREETNYIFALYHQRSLLCVNIILHILSCWLAFWFCINQDGFNGTIEWRKRRMKDRLCYHQTPRELLTITRAALWSGCSWFCTLTGLTCLPVFRTVRRSG